MYSLIENKKDDTIRILNNLQIKIHKIQKNGEIICFCPLHNDINPSLNLNYITGKFQCWSGCMKGHSLKDFIFKVSGEELNIVKEQQNEAVWLSIFKNKLKPLFGFNTLPSIPALPLALSNEGQEYLNSRGFTNDTIEDWSLFYWEEHNSIIIPIFEVGFIERFIGAKEKKYKYIEGTKITSSLFGIDKLTLTPNCDIIIVEGSLDVIWLHQLGFKNALGVLHSGISDTQVSQLISIGNDHSICLMLDSDLGGENAAQKIIKKLNTLFILKKCNLPEGRDPNDLTKELIVESLKNI